MPWCYLLLSLILNLIFRIINVVCRPWILFHTEFLSVEAVMLLYYDQNKGVLQYYN